MPYLGRARSGGGNPYIGFIRGPSLVLGTGGLEAVALGRADPLAGALALPVASGAGGSAVSLGVAIAVAEVVSVGAAADVEALLDPVRALSPVAGGSPPHPAAPTDTAPNAAASAKTAPAALRAQNGQAPSTRT
jgi:hypothetical protein